MKRLDPEDAKQLSRFLRSLHDWGQARLAEAAGLDPKSIGRYESARAAPTEENLERLTAAAGLPLSFVQTTLLPVLRLAREISGGRREGPSTLAEAEARRIGERIGESARVAALSFLSDAETASLAQERYYPPRAEHRRQAEESWKLLAPCSAAERRYLVERMEELWNWALSEILCDESEERAESAAEEARELTELAAEISRRAYGDNPAQARLRGYALAFVANARRAAGDLQEAEAILSRAWELWRAGESAPFPLEERRLLELEAALRTEQGRFEEALELLDRATRGEPREAPLPLRAAAERAMAAADDPEVN